MLGWIRGHAVGVFGLRDVDEALTCAPALRQALDDMLEFQYPDRYRRVRNFVDLRLVHDGAYEWIAAGNVPIARVHRPSAQNSNGSFAVEFLLPSYASERVTTAAAAILVDALHERVLSPALTCDAREPRSRAAPGRSRGKYQTRDVRL
jgi:hypothetical protein